MMLPEYRHGESAVHRLGSAWYAVVVPLLLSLTWAALSWGQPAPDTPLHSWPTTLPANQIRVGKEKELWTRQLEMARRIGGKALLGLRNAPMDDSVPIDSSVLQAARDNYVLIRAAKQGMEIFKNDQKFPDPIMELAVQRVTAAWHLARTAVDRHSWGLSRQEYLTVAVRDLGMSVQLVDQVLIILP